MRDLGRGYHEMRDKGTGTFVGMRFLLWDFASGSDMQGASKVRNDDLDN